jgi:polysaccharide biosynthesis protein PslE
MNESDTTANVFRDLVFIGCKRMPLIVLFFAGTFITVLIFTLLAKPTYEATVQILVKIGRESVYIPVSGSVNPVVAYDPEKQVNSEVEILKSPALAERLVQEFGPTSLYPSLKKKISDEPEITPASENSEKLLIATALKAFQSDLIVEAVKKSNLISLKFQHRDPVVAATAVNRLIEIYLEHHLAVHKDKQTTDFFQEQTNILKKKLEESEQRLETMRREYRITSLTEQQSLLLKEIAQLQSEHNRTINQELEIQKRTSELRRQVTSVPKSIDQGEEVDQNYQLLSNLQSRLLDLEIQEKQLLTKYTEDSRFVRNIREEIDVVRKKINEQAKVQYGKRKSGVNPTFQKLEEQLIYNDADYKALKIRNDKLVSQLASYQSDLDNLRQLETKLSQLMQDVEFNRQNYRLYLSKLEDSRIADTMDREKISSVSILEKARPPLAPVKPKVTLNLAIGVAVGLMGGITLAFVLEYFSDRFDRPEEVERFLQTPVLASIPEIRTG